jgi:hypothetical protein
MRQPKTKESRIKRLMRLVKSLIKDMLPQWLFSLENYIKSEINGIKHGWHLFSVIAVLLVLLTIYLTHSYIIWNPKMKQSEPNIGMIIGRLNAYTNASPSIDITIWSNFHRTMSDNVGQNCLNI